MINLLAGILSDFRFIDWLNSRMKWIKITSSYDMRPSNNVLFDNTVDSEKSNTYYQNHLSSMD